MKLNLSLTLSLLTYVSTAFSQSKIFTQTIDNCGNNEVVTPEVPKPTPAYMVNVNCNNVELTWQRQLVLVYDRRLENPPSLKPASYKISGTYFDPETKFKRVISWEIPPNNCNNEWCSVVLNVPMARGTTVNWTIQTRRYILIDVKFPPCPPCGPFIYVENKLLSYPARGSVAIPFCQQPNLKTSTQKKQSVTTAPKEKIKGEIYPNPVQSNLNVKYTSTSKNNVIKVFDVNGRIVITQQATQGTMQLNVSSLSNGIYFLRIENSTGKPLHTARFIKE